MKEGKTYDVRDLLERLLLRVLRRRMFAFLEVDGDEIEGDFLLVEGDGDAGGAGGDGVAGNGKAVEGENHDCEYWCRREEVGTLGELGIEVVCFV